MYDPKFEKEVRQRMEELEFHPAESVWANIEKAIVVPRRERRAGFFWRFLFPGLLVAAAAASMYVYHRSAGAAIHPVKPAIAVPQAALQADQSASQASQAAGAQTTSALTSRAGRSSRPQLVPSAARRLKNMNGKGTVSRDGNAAVSTGEDAPGLEADRLDEHSGKTAPGAWFYTPGLADQRFLLHVRASDLPARKGTVSLTSLSPVPHPWEAGFVAGAGLSSLNRLNAQANAAVLSYAASFVGLNRSSMSKPYVSDIKADISFEGGIYLQKTLSGRWIFNTGLNLHYYSTRIYVGQQVNAYVQTPSTYLNPSVTPTALTMPAYSAGNSQTYTNRYYFLELPAGVQWKINRNRLLPVFLEGGLSVARLMGANALFYDPATGVYSKDGSMVNRTQLYVRSGLMVGLPFRGIRIETGPEIEYGITPLVNTQSLGDQHFVYTGLRVVVLPIRK